MKKPILALGLFFALATAACAQEASWPPEKQKESEFTGRKLDTYQHGSRKEWGYEKGTVADIITEVLKKANQPLHRDEIVKQVLKSRFVKETTILLNLQGKPQFKRVAKATYALAE